MNLEFPPVEYLGIAYIGGMVTMILAAMVLKKQIRILDFASWMIFAIVAPSPILFSTTLGALVGMPTDALLPTVCLIAVIGTLFIHYLLPALAPDFQTQNISASAMCGFLLALVALGAGLAIPGAFPSGIMPVQQDVFGESKITWDDAKIGEDAKK